MTSSAVGEVSRFLRSAMISSFAEGRTNRSWVQIGSIDREIRRSVYESCPRTPVAIDCQLEKLCFETVEQRNSYRAFVKRVAIAIDCHGCPLTLGPCCLMGVSRQILKVAVGRIITVRRAFRSSIVRLTFISLYTPLDAPRDETRKTRGQNRFAVLPSGRLFIPQRAISARRTPV